MKFEVAEGTQELRYQAVYSEELYEKCEDSDLGRSEPRYFS